MNLGEVLALLLFLSLIGALALGFPVALTIGGVALIYAGIGVALGIFDPGYLSALPNRIYGTMGNETLLAVPLFVFMGLMLERSRIAERLLTTMAGLFGQRRGGLVIAVMLVGAVLAASTGIVGATVVTMGLIALPTMLKSGYDPRLACGTIASAGTLGQIIPPSVVLVLLGDQIGNAWQQAQLKLGNFSPTAISVGDLFIGALIPGLMLVGLYLIYLVAVAFLQPERAPALSAAELAARPRGRDLLSALFAPLLLVVLVLGSILGGIATPTEAAAIGAVGAAVLAALARQLSVQRLIEVLKGTVMMTSMVFLILIGATLFALVFRGYGGDDLVHRLLDSIPGGVWGAIFAVMLLMFLLGFVLDFIEIVFVVVPIVGPVLLMMGVDPLWLGVLIAMNLQTSFLTPPFGFALFYLRGVAPPSVPTTAIWRGVVPFLVIQLIMLVVLCLFPGLVTWLPAQLGD